MTINNIVHSQYLMNQLSILTIAPETGIWNSRSHVGKGWGTKQGCQRSHFPARGWSALWACRRTSEIGPYWEPSGSVLITNHIHQKDTFSNSSDTSLQQGNNFSSVYVSLPPGRYDWQWQSLHRQVGCIAKDAEQFLVFFSWFFLNFKSSRLLTNEIKQSLNCQQQFR